MVTVETIIEWDDNDNANINGPTTIIQIDRATYGISLSIGGSKEYLDDLTDALPYLNHSSSNNLHETSFESILNSDVKTPWSGKQRTLLAAYHGVVNWFDMGKIPYDK